MEIELLKKFPTLIIPEKIFANLLKTVRSTTLEMTFILHIERQQNWSFIVKEALIPPQWNEPAETKTIDSQYSTWCFNQVKNKKLLNGHGHTHPNMSVGPSGYDIQFFNELKKETNTFQFRLIMNHKGNIHCDLIDMERGFVITKLNVTVPCEGFNIIITNQNLKLKIINKTKLVVADITEEGYAVLTSNYLALSQQNITLGNNVKGLDFKPTRRSATDEAIVKPTNTKKTMPTEDIYMYNYNLERGFYGN